MILLRPSEFFNKFYSANYIQDWKAPPNTYYAFVNMIGSGGGGTLCYGGGAGGFVRGLIPITPGETYTIIQNPPTSGDNNSICGLGVGFYGGSTSSFSVKNGATLFSVDRGGKGSNNVGGSYSINNISTLNGYVGGNGGGYGYQYPIGGGGGGIGQGNGSFFIDDANTLINGNVLIAGGSGGGFFSTAGSPYYNATRAASGSGGGIGFNGSGACLASDGTSVYSGAGTGILGKGIKTSSTSVSDYVGGTDINGSNALVNTDAAIGTGGGGGPVLGSTSALVGKSGSLYFPSNKSYLSGLSGLTQVFYELFGVLGGGSSGSYAPSSTYQANGVNSICGGSGGVAYYVINGGGTFASGGHSLICGGGGAGVGSDKYNSRGGDGAGGGGGGSYSKGFGDSNGIGGNGGYGFFTIEWC